MIPNSIILHHTASSRDFTSLENVNTWHKARGFTKSSSGYFVGYHRLILGNGTICKTRNYNEIGCHCIPNEGKIGVALCGNFDLEMPNPEQLISLQVVLEEIKQGYNLTDENIFGHNEKSNTACPGKNLKIWLNKYRQVSILKKIIWSIQEFFKGRV